jgi:hypothetical protein
MTTLVGFLDAEVVARTDQLVQEPPQAGAGGRRRGHRHAERREGRHQSGLVEREAGLHRRHPELQTGAVHALQDLNVQEAVAHLDRGVSVHRQDVGLVAVDGRHGPQRRKALVGVLEVSEGAPLPPGNHGVR